MFIVSVVIKALNWKASKCLITIELINKFWYSHTMDDNRAMRINYITRNSVGKSHRYKFDQKEPNKKRTHIVWFHLHKIYKQRKLIHVDRSQDSCYLWSFSLVTGRKHENAFWGVDRKMCSEIHHGMHLRYMQIMFIVLH